LPRIGSLLVSDEVISFRLGYHGAQGRFAYDADLTALGKFIGGGFPVGAVAGRADVMSVFDPTGGHPLVSHGGTFNANPVSMVAGLKTMQLLTPDSLSDLDRKGDLLREMMTTVCQEMKVAVQVVGLGSLLRVHFSNAPLHDYRSAYFDEIANQKASALHAGFLRQGVVIAPYCLIALSTAMSDGDIHQIVHAFQAALEELISARLLSTR
jgi:glutamate-1-semialdehyde 2,1-aminomutase